MRKSLEKLETALIIIALLSLWPLLLEYDAFLYRVWLVLVLAAMMWVAGRRLTRVRNAAEEAKRKRDEMEKRGRPPYMDN